MSYFSRSLNSRTVYAIAVLSVLLSFIALSVEPAYSEDAGIKLTVNKSGDGSGMVMSTPQGISCGSACSAQYPQGTIVMLAAKADQGSTFGGWSGCETGTDDPNSNGGDDANKCKVKMSEAKTVTAKFSKGATTGITLTVRKSGSGKGTVTSSPAGISCGLTCSAPYLKDTVVTLTAAADTGSTFSGWSGCDPASDNVTSDNATNGICTVKMTASRNVVATFIGLGGVGRKVTNDFDGDGMSDILWHNQKTRDVAIWLMNSDNVTKSGSPGRVPLEWVIDGVGDFDGDGKADIVWRNKRDGSLYIWLMDGLNIASHGHVKHKIEKKNWYLKAVGDFNGDGMTDLLWRHKEKGDMVIWFMNGIDVVDAKYIDVKVPRSWDVAGVADFDGDGRDDILFRHEGMGALAMWLMDGEKIKKFAKVTDLKDPQWRIVRVGDFDGDGRGDILYRNQKTGQVALWFMDGANIKDAKSVAIVDDFDWNIVRVGDYNGDGKLDILWQNQTMGQLYMWLMDGAIIVKGGSLGSVDDPDWFVFTTSKVNVTPGKQTLTTPAVGTTATFEVDGGEAPYTFNVSRPDLVSASFDDAASTLTVTTLKTVTAGVRVIITIKDANKETAWAFVELQP
ncbi:MAG: VCBS repeat-containing protein [Nitrospirae bacterium]|nr:VCBS repeat-containing protein [Nitrospirota bacterium]